MENLEESVRQIIKDVIKGMDLSLPKDAATDSLGVFPTISKAIDASELSFREFGKLSLEIRKNIISNIRKVCQANKEIISKMAWKVHPPKNQVVSKEMGPCKLARPFHRLQRFYLVH